MIPIKTSAIIYSILFWISDIETMPQIFAINSFSNIKCTWNNKILVSFALEEN